MANTSPIQAQFEAMAQEIMKKAQGKMSWESQQGRIATLKQMKAELLELKQTYTDMFGEGVITTDAQFHEVIGIQ